MKKIGAIIEINSKELLKKFVKTEKIGDYQYLIISEQIKTNKKRDDVVNAEALIPEPKVISKIISQDVDRYTELYLDQLQRVNPLRVLCAITKASLDGMNILLISSHEEDSNYMYVSIIRSFLENKFRIKTCDYKEYCKDRDACTHIDNASEVIATLDNITERINDVMAETQKNKARLEDEEFIEAIKEMKRSEIKDVCKKYGIKIKGMKDMTKKQIARKMLKLISEAK